jgi:hypothetical protein
MRVGLRIALEAVALATVFGIGWSSGREKRNTDVPFRAELRLPPSAGAETSCLDRHAMEANRNLVEQVGEYRKRSETARQDAEASERRAAAVMSAPPSVLVPPPDEWARMARERTVRLRQPCASWASNSSHHVLRANGSRSIDVTSSYTRTRTTTAGLSDAEVESLDEAYTRAQSKTWLAMKTVCERSDVYRDLLAEAADDIEDRQRIDLCTSALLDTSEIGVRNAIRNVATLRAARATIDRTTSDEERVVFVVSQASAVLYDAMVATLGSEKARRAIDNGVLCVDETVVDLRDPPPEQ